MKYKQAYDIATEVKARLEPHCERIEIAGSIRRKKPECRDIEIVCIPKQAVYQAGLFENAKTQPLPGFVDLVNSWKKVKGDPTGKYTQRILKEKIKLDLFIANPDNWGFIFAIRTGSDIYCKKVLAYRWKQLGLTGVDGFLTQFGKRIPIKEEYELFDMLHLNFLAPELREVR